MADPKEGVGIYKPDQSWALAPAFCNGRERHVLSLQNCDLTATEAAGYDVSSLLRLLALLKCD